MFSIKKGCSVLKLLFLNSFNRQKLYSFVSYPFPLTSKHSQHYRNMGKEEGRGVVVVGGESDSC